MVETDQRTAAVNGPLWGRRAIDWSQLMEPNYLPIYHAALERCGVMSGTRLLDVGCGSGLAAATASHRGADVSGVDASAAMLEIARSRVPAGDFRIADLESLPFDDHEFDVVTGFNAFQYAGHPVRALGEARRVVKPEGLVLIMTWGSPEGMEAASSVATLDALMPPALASASSAFAWSDETRLRDVADQAGLTADEIFDVEAPWIFGSFDEANRALKSPGAAARAIAHSGEVALDEANARLLEPFRRANGGYRLGATFRCLVTRA